MSAFICNDTTLNIIVSKFNEMMQDRLSDLYQIVKMDYPEFFALWQKKNNTALVQHLRELNYVSVSVLYPDNLRPYETASFSMQKRRALEAYSACQMYLYQCCEPDNFLEDKSYRLVMEIQAELER